ncbi:copper resistance protein NlpE [Riemerella columbipharyngis]|uniref:NlpE N-terminal domain-containing protein n=1 Tax=Riemerella columbipharyngis TaxID=1071918 RepID=A0A1G7F3Z5_9FLAO|nr:copper resistance protein NlpE [Riemerella columbipharyngis]SDE70582.1 NlpE N-terminal domain-containing protein [Riemerella columbipharyngis]
MKKIFLSLAVLGLVIVSCSKKHEDTAKSTDSTAVNHTDMPAMEMNTDAWVGEYTGTLPAADAPGMDVDLTLNADNTYDMKIEYKGKDDKFEDKGTIEWDASKSYISLINSEDKNDIQIFMVHDGVLYQVAEVGDTDMKPDYKLTKK